MTILDWPEGERPREKLLKQGARYLSDAELLAIFLRVGVKGKSAVALARELLNTFGSLNGVFAANLEQVEQVNGMGTSKYCQLQAVFEMSRRALAEEMKTRDNVSSPDKVRDYLRLTLQTLHHEVFLVVFLDTQNSVITHEILFEGTLTQASVYPREVIKRALYHNAAAVIFAHNHPSGHASPSAADKILTQTLKQALALIDITAIDHFVVAGDQLFSFAESGLM